MAEIIRLRKGLDIKLLGAPVKELTEVGLAESYALCPDDFTGVTPKPVVKEQQTVKAGEALFIDKNHPEVKFVSPVSGEVVAVNRGARRKVLSIVVKPDAKQTYVEFGTKSVQSLSGEEVKAALLESGLFSFFRQRPYDVIANPADAPRGIFVSAFDSKPLAPDFEFVLQGNEVDFRTGLSAIAKIAPTTLSISASQTAEALTDAKNVDLYAFKGAHPAGNVGVQINHVAPIAKGETVWTVNIQDLRLIGTLLQKGIVDMHKRVALTGPLVREPKYYEVLPGMSVSTVLKCNIEVGIEPRYIAGNALSGQQITLDDSISLYDNQFTVIAQGTETHEFMGWIMPPLLREGEQDARLKGGRRAIIVSGEYERVFPMDIYPEHLIKAMIAGNLDRMEALGAYEVAPEDFAVCEYVCTSKMPLQAIVRAALDNLKQEIE